MVEKTLGDVATYINGRAFKPQEWETSGRPIIRIQNLTNSTQECNRTTKQFEEKYRISDGDLLFAWSASLGAHIWHGEDGWLNQHIFKVIPNESIDINAKKIGAYSFNVPSIPEQEKIVSVIQKLLCSQTNIYEQQRLHIFTHYYGRGKKAVDRRFSSVLPTF